jgi:hypothetical protein
VDRVKELRAICVQSQPARAKVQTYQALELYEMMNVESVFGLCLRAAGRQAHAGLDDGAVEERAISLVARPAANTDHRNNYTTAKIYIPIIDSATIPQPAICFQEAFDAL